MIVKVINLDEVDSSLVKEHSEEHPRVIYITKLRFERKQRSGRIRDPNMLHVKYLTQDVKLATPCKPPKVLV